MKKDIVSANESLNKWCNTNGINFHQGTEALGNLFKYAVPKLKGFPAIKIKQLSYGQWQVRINIGKDFVDDELSSALFWAIWEVIKR